MIPVRTFGLSVILFKMIQRSGSNGIAAPCTAAIRTIDLTPYLGQGGSVRTAKSIREASGSFSISFSDQMEPKSMESIYRLVEPMDMIEIRASRQPEKYAGAKLPLIMRGFVGSISRPESMDEDGPNRNVLIQGEDFGKLWKIHSVYPEPAIVTGRLMLTTFGLQAATGIETTVMSAPEFMKQMTEKVMNVAIAELSAISNRQVAPFATDTIATVPGLIIPTQAGGLYGTLWQIINNLADRPWNELFIQDQENGPHVVFREAPFKDINGALIMPNAVDPGITDVDIADVVSLYLARTDTRVANFFWVPAGSSSLDTVAANKALALQDGTILDFSYGNNSPDLYGEKKMEAGMQLQPPGLTAPVQSLSAQDGSRAAAVDKYNSFWRTRIGQLKAMNRDNAVFEDGQAVVCGREDLVCGKYVRLHRGGVTCECYMPRVAHTILPLQTWTTDLALERGTGFLKRRNIKAPYVTEGMQGPYTPGTRAPITEAKVSPPPGGFIGNGIRFAPSAA